MHITGCDRSPRFMARAARCGWRPPTYGERNPAAMALLPRRRIKRTQDRNGRPNQPFRTRLALALGDDRGRRLAFAHEASAEAEAGDNQYNCQCELFHVTPLALERPLIEPLPLFSLISASLRAAALVPKNHSGYVFSPEPWGCGKSARQEEPGHRKKSQRISSKKACFIRFGQA